MLLRYPGGKTRGKLNTIIVQRLVSFLKSTKSEFREPFFGSGGIGFSVLKSLPVTAWFNDLDRGVISLWESVRAAPERLEEMILAFIPSVDAFYQFREDLIERRDADPVVVGFKKLVTHQTSFSGLGPMGGPLGGRDQKSNFKIDCRWQPRTLVKKLWAIKNLIPEGTRFTNGDFEDLIRAPGQAVLYLDPPYYVKGDNLYLHGFAGNHQRLADALRSCPHPWLLSYDDCDDVRDLYKWAKCEVINTKYSLNDKRKTNELLISNWE